MLKSKEDQGCDSRYQKHLLHEPQTNVPCSVRAQIILLSGSGEHFCSRCGRHPRPLLCSRLAQTIFPLGLLVAPANSTCGQSKSGSVALVATRDTTHHEDPCRRLLKEAYKIRARAGWLGKSSRKYGLTLDWRLSENGVILRLGILVIFLIEGSGRNRGRLKYDWSTTIHVFQQENAIGPFL